MDKTGHDKNRTGQQLQDAIGDTMLKESNIYLYKHIYDRLKYVKIMIVYFIYDILLFVFFQYFEHKGGDGL